MINNPPHDEGKSKTCCTCKMDLPLPKFSKLKTSKDGHKYQCKKCIRLFYLENKEKILKTTNDYYRNNKEEINKKSKLYRDNNKEKISKQKHEYTKKNSVKIKERTFKKKEEKKIYMKKYREENKEKLSSQMKKYKDKNKRKSRAQKRVFESIRKGDMKRKSFCEICNKERYTQGHHVDYNIPLIVVWSCLNCHMDIHKGITDLAEYKRDKANNIFLDKVKNA